MLRVSRSTIAHNDQETTLLTHTTAMSCPSFSIPAGFTCPGASKHPDSPCAHCYACQGMYLLDTTARAQWIRYRWTRDCMKSAEGRMEWIETMAGEISATGCEYFRWHDSGDLFSAAYVKMVAEVCRLTIHIRHWLPTQSFNVPAIDRAIQKHLLPVENVIVRPSTARLDAYPPRLRSRGYSAGATVYTSATKGHTSVRMCPKSTLGGSCESNGCRLCWTAPKSAVGFLVHGIGGKGKKTRVTDRIREIREGQRAK